MSHIFIHRSPTHLAALSHLYPYLKVSFTLLVISQALLTTIIFMWHTAYNLIIIQLKMTFNTIAIWTHNLCHCTSKLVRIMLLITEWERPRVSRSVLISWIYIRWWHLNLLIVLDNNCDYIHILSWTNGNDSKPSYTYWMFIEWVA